MKGYTVRCTLEKYLAIQIEAESEDEAIEKASAISFQDWDIEDIEGMPDYEVELDWDDDDYDEEEEG